MNTTNKLHISREHRDLSAIYAETKELEKRMQGSLEQLTSNYSLQCARVKHIVDNIVSAVRREEKNVLLKSEIQRDRLFTELNSQWNQFKQYGRLVRRAYLGEQKDQKIELLQMPVGKGLTGDIQNKLVKLQNISNVFEVHFERVLEVINNISSGNTQNNIATPGKKAIDNLLAQISPIKPNLRRGILSTDIGEQQDRQLHFRDKDSFIYMNQSSFRSSNKLCEEKKGEHSTGRSAISKGVKASRDNTQVANKIMSSVQSEGILKTKPLLSLSKRATPQNTSQKSIRFFQNNDLQTKGELKKHNRLYLYENQFRCSIEGEGLRSVRYKKTPRQILAQRTPDNSVSKGFKGCLQKLQKQQKQYEKLKRGC